MKSFNFSIKSLLFLCSAAFLFSCEKVEVAKDAGDAGQTIVKLPSTAGLNKMAMDIVATPQTINVLEVRRDVHNEASLNSSLKVMIKEDPTGVEEYNDEHNTTYEVLPASAYTADASNPKSGDQYTLTFAPGEFVKYLKFSIPNSSALDPNKKFATSFTITSVEGDGKVSATQPSAVVEVGLKNIWDGVYTVVSGFVQRYTAPGVPENPTTLGGSLTGNPDITLTTIDGNTLAVSGYQWANSGGTIGGIDGLRMTVDPATNQVTWSSVGTATAPGNATLASWAGHDNYYDPATKTFHVSFRWNPAGATRELEMVLKYKRPR
jgi:hypothetical protein